MNVRVWAASSSWRQLAARQKCPVHRYQFPPQETELRGGEGRMRGRRRQARPCRGYINSQTAGWTSKSVATQLASIPKRFLHINDVNTTVLADALLRIGEYVADHGLEGDGPYQAARDLLMRREPRVHGQPLRVEGETALEAARRLALALDGGVMPIQGPPGSGKTYTGARMITEMVKPVSAWA